MKIKATPKALSRQRDEADPALQIGTLFLLVFGTYFATAAYKLPSSLVPAFWALLAAYGLAVVRQTAWVLAGAVHLLLLTFFLMGMPPDDSGSSAAYLRNLATSFVFATLVLGMLRRDLRDPGWLGLQTGAHVWIHRLASLGLLAWTALSIQHTIAARVVDVREVTGFSYLTTSDLVAMFGLASICRRRIGMLDFLLVAFCCMMAILFLGSRATMLGFGMFVLAAYLFRLRGRAKAIMGVAAVTGIYFALTQLLVRNSDIFARFWSLLEIGEDKSVSERFSIFDSTLNRLETDPSCFIVPCHPEPGRYAHNFISLIEYFGLLGVVIVLASLVLAPLYWREVSRSQYAYLFCYLLMLFVIARAWTSIIFPPLVALSLQLIFMRSVRAS